MGFADHFRIGFGAQAQDFDKSVAALGAFLAKWRHRCTLTRSRTPDLR